MKKVNYNIFFIYVNENNMNITISVDEYIYIHPYQNKIKFFKQALIEFENIKKVDMDISDEKINKVIQME